MASEHDIIVVDDHPLFRRGVIQLLKMDPSFNVVAEAGDFEAAMVAVRERDPDIVLLDLNMKHTSGVEILTAIKTFLMFPCVNWPRVFICLNKSSTF